MDRPLKVKELFTDESKWTIGSYARDSYGTNVEINHPGVDCWCLMGALMFVYQYEPEYYNNVKKIDEYLRNNKGFKGAFSPMTNITTWNDTAAKFQDVKELVEELDI